VGGNALRDIGDLKAAAPSDSPPACIVAAKAEGKRSFVDIKTDVGFGNTVFLRGSGGGLNWEKGLPLECVDAGTWRWTGQIQNAMQFKPLVNDEVWSVGENFTVNPGDSVKVKPSF
jgi:hypothetical protein